VLKRAKAGVLFIDEAHYLYRPENERDYGQEAIEILLPVMEPSLRTSVVILAGYKDRTETFFRSNPGRARASLRLAASLRHGWTPASLLLSRLHAGSRTSPLASAAGVRAPNQDELRPRMARR
jgi:hypothetical protein